MKKLIMKMLGLDNYIKAVNLTVEILRNQNEELKKKIEEINEKLEEIEVPDMDDYVSESDINDRIESFMNDNDYCTQSYVDDEIESKVSEKVEEAISDADIEEKVRDLFNDASPAPMSEQEIKDEIIRQLRVLLMDEIEVKLKLK